MNDADLAGPERWMPEPDDPGGPLVKADDDTLVREMVTILASFGRYSNEQIGAVLNRPPEEVAARRETPEVLEAIATLRSLLPRPGDVNEALMSDAERNIRWVRNLREGIVDNVRIGTDAKTLAVRTSAAKMLMERQVAKKVEVVAPGLRTIDVTPQERDRMRGLLNAPRRLEAPKDGNRALTDADFDTV